MSESPIEAVRRRAAVTASQTVDGLVEQVETARRDRARAFAAWHAAGTSYNTMAKVSGLGRSTVIDLVRWGDELGADDQATHPRNDRE